MIRESLGHYEIIEPLGAGGMGQVYRARDANLRRDVAIKVLPPDLAGDPGRLARLEREAHLLAALNHSNIAAIYSLEEFEGTRFLVMELVKGQSLEELLADGPLQIEDALDICRQIAEALEAAHEEGIIHRDLKPANVLVTRDGKAKVLDFGLAKVIETATSDTDLSHSPTITIAATEAGVILGTAPYMSPEQVRGKRLDERADIWAFGCVLYEALTGRRAFSRETVADTLAAILEIDPPWDALPRATPVAVQSLLRRCLRKDRRSRLHDIADARIETEEALGLAGPETVPMAMELPPAPVWRTALPWGVAAAGLVLGAVAVLWSLGGNPPTRTPGPAARPLRSLYTVPGAMVAADTNRNRVILARDGSRFAYDARVNAGVGDAPGLYVQDFDRVEPRGPFTGLGGARGRFFSDDGDWIFFYDEGELRRVAVSGGAPEKICDLPGGAIPGMPGGTWAPEDTVIFYADDGLWRVQEDGGQPQPIATPEEASGGYYIAPQAIPGRDAITYLSYTSAMQFPDEAEIMVLDLETERSIATGKTGNLAIVAPTGHLLYERDRTLYAVAFDLDSYETSGAPVSVLEDDEWLLGGAYGNPAYAVADNGTFVYQRMDARPATSALMWLDSGGETEIAVDRTPTHDGFRLSPDGKLVAFNSGLFNEDILVYEVSGGLVARVGGDWRQLFAAWSADSRGFYYREEIGQVRSLHYYDLETFSSRPFNPPLPDGYTEPAPYSISSDGRLMALAAHHPSTGSDILLLPLDGEQVAWPWLATGADETGPMFSPDGRLIAYLSNRSSVRDEGYVRAAAAVSGQGTRVASGRLTALKWKAMGSELHYMFAGGVLAPFKVWTVSVGPDAELIDAARVEFDFGPQYAHAQRMWEVGRDGRLLVTRFSIPEGAGRTFHVVHNWFEVLKEKVPTGR